MSTAIHRQLALDSYRELKAIYSSLFIRFFALGMIDVLFPAYLVTLGYPLATVVLYWVVFWAANSAFFLVAREASHRFGAKNTVLLSTISRLLFLWLVFSMNDSSAPIYLYALLDGFATALLWYPINVDFTVCSHARQRSREVGYLYAIPQIGKALAPALGAGLLLVVGFHGLFLIVALVVALSLIPFFLSSSILEETKSEWYAWKSSFSLKSADYFVASAVDGMLTMLFSFGWPVFIFLMFFDTTTVGIASTVAFLPVLFSIYVVSELADRGWKSALLRCGAVLSAAVWLAAGFVSTSFEVIALSFVAGIAALAMTIPIRSYVFSRIKRQSIEGGVILREFGLGAGRLLPLIVIIAFGAVFPASFVAAFLFVAAAFLFTTNMKL